MKELSHFSIGKMFFFQLLLSLSLLLLFVSTLLCIFVLVFVLVVNINLKFLLNNFFFFMACWNMLYFYVFFDEKFDLIIILALNCFEF